MLTEGEKLEALTRLSVDLNQIKDLDILMEHILSEARRVVNADAGSIYIRNHNELQFSYTQNATLEKRLAPGEKLIYSTFSIPVDTSSIAGYSATTGEMVNIANAYELGDDVPYSFGRQFDEATGYRTQSILAVPLKTVRGDIIGVLQVINAQDHAGRTVSFSRGDERIMAHFASMATVALERAQMTRTLILRMIRMAELRDPQETGAHVNRVGAYSVELFEGWAQRQGLEQREIQRRRDVLRMAAMLHDVGKVAISDQILRKPGRLTPEEYEIMKRHTVYGARLFFDKKSDFDEAAAEVALNHHEWWNGEGYPGRIDLASTTAGIDQLQASAKPPGKRGEEIPLYGRIVAIADVYDALASRRSYKEAWEEADILRIMEQQSGSQFDPQLMEVFFARVELLKAIRQRYPG